MFLTSFKMFFRIPFMTNVTNQGSAGKESTCNVGDLGLIPGLGRSPGEGKGYPLQYSGLENSINCIVHRVTKSWTRLSDFHSHHRGLECKSRKSRDTWNNRQVWPWSTKWIRAKANRVLPREFTGHSKHPLPTIQETTLHMAITSWPILKPDLLYSFQTKMEKLYTVNINKTRSWLWLRPWTPYCQIQT